MSNSGAETSAWSQPPRRPESDDPPPLHSTNNSQAPATNGSHGSSPYDLQASPRRNNHTHYSNTNMGHRGSRMRLVEGTIDGIPAQCYGHLVGRGGEFARYMTAGENTLTSYHVNQQKRKRDGDISIRMRAETQEILNHARSYLLNHIDSYFDRRD